MRTSGQHCKLFEKKQKKTVRTCLYTTLGYSKAGATTFDVITARHSDLDMVLRLDYLKNYIYNSKRKGYYKYK